MVCYEQVNPDLHTAKQKRIAFKFLSLVKGNTLQQGELLKSSITEETGNNLGDLYSTLDFHQPSLNRNLRSAG